MLINLAERGYLPDALVRLGIRQLLHSQLRSVDNTKYRASAAVREQFNEMLRLSEIAPEAATANEQHYELPATFFEIILGYWLKYSAGYWDSQTKSLDEAEELMLSLTTSRAEIRDGMRIIDLGCGWGSFTRFILKKFPSVTVVGVSNSASQREFICSRLSVEERLRAEIITANVDSFQPKGSFDRVVSVEMFEHLRNYERLTASISHWLFPGGKLFVHIFTHRDLSYLFQSGGSTDWMGRYFFREGMMPSNDLLPAVQSGFILEKQWRESGIHYQKSLEAWLAKLDSNRVRIRAAFEPVYGSATELWIQRWRIFLMACSELFGFKNGTEWGVSHYLFAKDSDGSAKRVGRR